MEQDQTPLRRSTFVPLVTEETMKLTLEARTKVAGSVKHSDKTPLTKQEQKLVIIFLVAIPVVTGLCAIVGSLIFGGRLT